jgi:hypothetical protein
MVRSKVGKEEGPVDRGYACNKAFASWKMKPKRAVEG